MRRVDYINQEPVMCFPTPIIDLKNKKNEMISISSGDFSHLSTGKYAPISTYYYKYKENLAIVDFNREKPVVHIIKNSKIMDTIHIEQISERVLDGVEQFIDIKGVTLNISDLNSLKQLTKDAELNKKLINKAYLDTKRKLHELIDSSDNMRKLDKIKGTKRVLDFISESNFYKIKSCTSNLYKTNVTDIAAYKQELLEIDSFKIYVVISNLLERELYDIFKTKNKEHVELLSKAKEETDKIAAQFEKTWHKEDLFKKEKELGIYFDCLNEMYCTPSYTSEDIGVIEDLIAEFVEKNKGIVNSYIEWVDLCAFDKEDALAVFNEILEKKEPIKINSDKVKK